MRDPVARNISCFFQQINRRYEDFYNQVQNGDIQLEQLIKDFLEKEDHTLPLRWFDTELNSIFNFNIYENYFDKEKGYSIYSNEKIEIIILKLEKIDTIIGDAFYEFFGIKNINLPKLNISKEKSYYYIYQEFKKKIIIPDELVSQIYDSKFINHFYTHEEINKFRSRWH